MADERFDKPPSYYEAVAGSDNQSTLNNNANSTSPPSYNDAVVGASGGELTTPYGWANDLYNTTTGIESLEVPCSSESEVTEPDYSQRTVIPYDNFDVKEDAIRIATALKSDDEDTLIDVLCTRSFDQRQKIAEFYESYYNIRLAKSIKNEISKTSDFSVLMCGLTIPFTEYIARAVHNSYSFEWLCYIMFTLTKADHLAIKSYFETKYQYDMVDFIINQIYAGKHHPDKSIITQIKRCLLCTRDFYNTYDMVQTNLRHLYEIDNGGKEIIKSVFYNNSLRHIRSLIESYEQETGKNIEPLIESTYSNNAFIFLKIVMYLKSPAQYFASLLHKSMKGLGTDTTLLSTVILMRCEIDMVPIKSSFLFCYRDTLRKWISGDTSGHYKHALYKLIGENPSQN